MAVSTQEKRESKYIGELSYTPSLYRSMPELEETLYLVYSLQAPVSIWSTLNSSKGPRSLSSFELLEYY